LSKLSQLKQEAYLAAKKRNWEQAVSVYERILELDKNNPTVINELGDVCLKGGDTQTAVRHFLNAASKYRATGLLNNAVAIYKKILRYDAENQNAHWYLAETRASQGLTVEGENHGLHFLDNSGKVTGDIKEIFLKRCGQLFELYPDSDPILDRLVQIYRMWKMPLEAARAACLMACHAWDAGDHDKPRTAVEQMLGQTPELQNYPEYAQWQKRVRPGGQSPAAFADFGQVNLESPAAATKPTPAAPAPAATFGELSIDDGAADAPAVDAADTSADDDGSGASADDLPAGENDAVAAAWNFAASHGAAIDTADGDDAADDAIAIDADGADFDALVAEATSQMARRRGGDGPAPEVEIASAADEAGLGVDGGTVDLLAEILADDTNLLAGGETSQLESITREIGTQVGGDESDQDPASLYEMGTVYLEMGMHLQACESFAKATSAGDPSYTSRAYEMWGVTLERAGRLDEAVEVLRRGVAQSDPSSVGHLGLLYNLGKVHETAGHADEAVAAYEQIHQRDPGYLDVGRRLSRLVTA